MPLGNVPGDSPGDSLGNVPGDVAGNVPGNVRGDSIETSLGDVAGNVLDTFGMKIAKCQSPVANLQWTGHQSVNRAGMYPATFPGCLQGRFQSCLHGRIPGTCPILFPATHPRTFPLAHSHHRRRTNRRIARCGWELKIRIAIAYKGALTAARIGRRSRGQSRLGCQTPLLGWHNAPMPMLSATHLPELCADAGVLWPRLS